jgi:hypothetical protein
MKSAVGRLSRVAEAGFGERQPRRKGRQSSGQAGAVVRKRRDKRYLR